MTRAPYTYHITRVQLPLYNSYTEVRSYAQATSKRLYTYYNMHLTAFSLDFRLQYHSYGQDFARDRFPYTIL